MIIFKLISASLKKNYGKCVQIFILGVKTKTKNLFYIYIFLWGGEV